MRRKAQGESQERARSFLGLESPAPKKRLTLAEFNRLSQERRERELQASRKRKP